MTTQLHCGDCLEVMPTIPDGSIDLILADPPYGTTANKWDSIIPLDLMWAELKRIIKPNGAIVMTASQPFTTILIASNMKMFKYCWVWEKDQSASPLNAPFQPLKTHEDIVVYSLSAATYSRRGTMVYIPQKTTGHKSYRSTTKKEGSHKFHSKFSGHKVPDNKGDRYPRSVQRLGSEKGLHPAQKPVALMGYMIRTYTLEGETVLDFTMGSGTTGIACQNTGRNFIGVEKDEAYFQIAKDRLEENEWNLINIKETT